MPTVHVALLGRFAVSVDGAAIPDRQWGRRHAAALVKVLALAPELRLHREQVIDLIWPDDMLDVAVPKLHKAAYFARRTLGDPEAVVLSGDTVALFAEPDMETVVDVVQFEELARRALAEQSTAIAAKALALYGGELLPEDRYEPWAESRREQLRLRHLDLLRMVGRWDAVLDIDPTDEAAHLAIMRRHAASGDRHGALRQFERMDRALRTELGVTPSKEARALRDHLLAHNDVQPRADASLVGRDREVLVLDEALGDTAIGRGRVLLISGPAGMGKSRLLDSIATRAREAGLRVGQGTAARVEGAWPYAPIVEALADVCRQHPALLDGLADQHREAIDRALGGGEVAWAGESSHQRLFVATAELVRLTAATSGLLLCIDDVHDADDASLRLVHYIARSMRDQRVCIALTHRPSPMGATWSETRRSLVERQGAIELELAPLDADATADLVRRQLPDATAETLERIRTLSRGVPFAVNELARRAAQEPRWVEVLDANMIGGIAAGTREVLQRVAVVGSSFDTDEFVALSGLSEADAFARLDDALAAVVIEPTATGYRFRHGLVRDALLEEVPPHRRRRIHGDAAARLIELGASAARIGHHLLEAGATGDAVPYLLRAAETDAGVGAYRDALRLVDSIRPHATGTHRSAALSLRADLLNAIGDPMALSAYREALDEAEGPAARRLRVRFARCAVMSGDLDTAMAVLEGLDTDGGVDDADILLTRGKCAFFTADFETAQAATEAAQTRILAGERNWKVLDLVTLQGLLAHRSGGWFDRMRLELRRTRDNPELANAIFDGYLCAAEYMLYGPTPYAEVIAVAQDLQTTAKRSGALRAAAFASALIGEAALLSGRLELATAELVEASELHHDLASAAGEAHSLQRLAEVRVAQGDNAEAMRLLREALPIARSSIIAKHLLQRVFGTMVNAATDPLEARAIVDRAESMLGWDDNCPFCSIMFSVPAVIACTRAGDREGAGRHLAAAERSAVLWQGTSWGAAMAEARAAVATVDGDLAAAETQLLMAAEEFARAGQPLDAERCRHALRRTLTPL
ncbi:MAG: transcriptional regulator, family [Acidimicrobiia bacterium]|nr:transcriptional regulator, family [Acidimicrobiia bacterium]